MSLDPRKGGGFSVDHVTLDVTPTAIMASPCWCWRSPRSSDDACGFCGWPKGAHHDNGYRSGEQNGREVQ